LVVKGIDSYKDFSSIDAKRFDGILLMSQSESDILFIYEIIKKGIPLVVLNREVEDSSVFNILSADRKGAYDAVAFLIDNGHRNIAFIEGEKGFHASMERREGYISALIDHNILINKEYIVDGNYTLQSGYDAMKKLLSLEQIPTAVFCSNDAMAVGAMKAISEGGWNIPRDISLVGFDESPISSFVTPALTTVSRSIKDISSEGMKRLLYKINNNNMQSQERKIYINPNLVIRDSVAKVK
jgi:LacI family transcriptional regulator